MRNRYIKNARVIISLAFLLAISFAFLDIKNELPIIFIDIATYLQFIPSLTQFVTTLSLAALGFAVVILLTLAFGRVYCSSICPLGTLQDIFSFISRKLKKRKKYKYAKPKIKLRYAVLVSVIVLFALGGIFFISLLDPFSIYGRLTANIVRPLYTVLNNMMAKGLEAIELYILYPKALAAAGLSILLLSFAFLVLIGWLSFWHGRIYCNTVCPVGTVLGLFSKLSIYKLGIDKDACTNCGECSIVCKARCIDIKGKRIDFSRCVGCFDCIVSCPEAGIRYKANIFKHGISESGLLQRRVMITAGVASLLSYTGLGKLAWGTKLIEASKPTTIPEEKNFPVSPPGSISIEHMKSACTACHLCVSACPTNVLQPSTLEYGALGFMQPVMDNTLNYCNYECTRCGDVCPTGAIVPLSVDQKKLTQIGKVHFIKESCVVYTDDTACGSCSEHCPTQAVHMVPYKEGITIPEVDESICIGCGACEYACPTRPFRAIYVDGNYIHVMAEPPKIEKLETDSAKEEFPF